MKRRKGKHRKKSGGLPAKGRLRDIADRLWSLAVKVDWNHCCAVCGTPKCDSHHLVPRQHEATRYDLRNGITLCSQHHQFDKDVSPHQNAAGFILWLEDHWPLRAAWLRKNCRPQFEGTVTPDYYCGVIRLLRQYVEPEDFDRIVGVKLSSRLKEAERTPNA